MQLRSLMYYVTLSLMLWSTIFLPCPADARMIDGFEHGARDEEQPRSAEAVIGGHRVVATVTSKYPSTADVDDATKAAYKTRCWLDDVVVLTVFQDGHRIWGEEFCSAYGISSVRFYADARNVPYLFVEQASNRGTNATYTSMDVYSVAESVVHVGGFMVSEPVSLIDRIDRAFKVTAPPEGGLIVDTKVIEWPESREECCAEIPETSQTRIHP